MGEGAYATTSTEPLRSSSGTCSIAPVAKCCAQTGETRVSASATAENSAAFGGAAAADRDLALAGIRREDATIVETAMGCLIGEVWILATFLFLFFLFSA